MTETTPNGRARRGVSVPAHEGGSSTIPLSVGGRNGLQPHTEGKFVWKVELGAKKNYARLGERLACSDDLYRNGSDGLGLIQVLPNGKTRLITKGVGTGSGARRPHQHGGHQGRQGHRRDAAGDPSQRHAPLGGLPLLLPPRGRGGQDAVLPRRLHLVQPGYHDGGPGKRILYVGPVPEISDSMATITAFLDVMEFATERRSHEHRRSRPHDPPAAPVARGEAALPDHGDQEPRRQGHDHRVRPRIGRQGRHPL